MKVLRFTCFLLLFFTGLTVVSAQKPKLVVGIVVDQMRPDYLIRYKSHFSEDGFKRLMEQGAWCKNVHYNYLPTYTGPGHASIYTGTTPRHHGIIANDWYSRAEEQSVYCVEDNEVKTVGTASDRGQMAPTRLLATTFTDQLRIQSQFRGKVVGVAIKDRGSILPAGHQPTGAYWYDKTTGDFITSTYYTNELPTWVREFNAQKRADNYLNEQWTLMLEESAYTESEGDNQPYERIFKGKETSSFPYDLKNLRKENGDFALLPGTPFGNQITTDFALAALEGEDMGMDEELDFLALSYSSTDYIGHAFGPQSKEIEDCYIRLDLELARLFGYLDEEIGEENYLVFLTADHAAAEAVGYMQKHNMPAGSYSYREMKSMLNEALQERFEIEDLVVTLTNEQVYLNHEKISSADLEIEEVAEAAVNTVLSLDGVVNAYPAAEMDEQHASERVVNNLKMGLHPKRSGDVLLVFAPGWMSKLSYATTHGTAYSYDSHVPLLWYGAGIPGQTIYTSYSITDIAYTLSMMLDISLPNAAIGKPILELLNQ